MATKCDFHAYIHVQCRITSFLNVSGNCSYGDVRLADGKNIQYGGRVEVCIGGLWGTVCDDHWDIYETIVVCRQQGISDSKGIDVYNILVICETNIHA